jgi:hypothetical protein
LRKNACKRSDVFGNLLYLCHLKNHFVCFDTTKSGEIFQTVKCCKHFIDSALLFIKKIIADLRRYMNKDKLKAVLFDMDGVLYDSMKNHALSWTKVMLRHGFLMTEQEAYMHEGRTGDDP